MKKYTNKILVITAIVLVLAIVIGYTIDFQSGYRSGRIKYEEQNLDSLEMVIRDAMNEEESYTVAEDTPDTSSPQDETKPTEQ